jgi:predicted amidohydrolase
VDTWSLLLRARAAENQYFTAGINRVGRDGGEAFGGCSALADPFGNLLAGADDQPQVIRGRLDPELIRSAREFNDSLAHRRTDLYSLHWSGTVRRVDLAGR